jgi:AcrR family transcriptional regulator
VRRFADFPLRDRKRAQTRVALARALLAHLSERTLSEIAVTDLCADAQVSPATFFNYFPSKVDLLSHQIQLWSLRVDLHVTRALVANPDPLAAVSALFVETAREFVPYPRVMLEIVAEQARWTRASLPPVELVERLLFLEDVPEAEALSDGGLDALLFRLIGEAVTQGALPAGCPVPGLVLGAGSIFFGVPLLLARSQPEVIPALYEEQLALLWAGARARYGADRA